MKNLLTAAFAAAVLLAAPSAFAAPAPEGPRRPPGPAYYGGRDRGPDHGYNRTPDRGYDRGPRPDYRAPDCRDDALRPAPARYDQGYGYEPAPPAYPPPQPRRPVAVAIQIHL